MADAETGPAQIRKLHLFFEKGSFVGDGWRVMLDVSEVFGRPCAFSIPQVALVSYDWVDRLKRARVLDFDPAECLSRLEASLAACERLKVPADRVHAERVIAALKALLPKKTLPPARVRVRLPPARVRVRQAAATTSNITA